MASRYQQAMPKLVFIAAILGCVVGILLGPKAQLFQPIGQLYVMLMEVVVYPYILFALIHAIGRMDPKTGLRLFKRGWIWYLVLIAATFTVLAGLNLFIPASHSSILINDKHVNLSQGLIDILIPANLFSSLVNNYVPAIVLFSIIFGIGLQFYPNKSTTLGLFEIIKKTCIKLWSWIVLFTPLAIFCLLANTAGTIDLNNVTDIGAYLILFHLAAAMLVIYLLPALIAALSPVSYKEIMRHLREAFIISIATTLSVAAIPAIEKAINAILKKERVDDPRQAEIVSTATAVSYPIAQLGNFFLYIFIVFAAFYFHRPISASQQIYLPLVTTLSGIGSPSSSVAAAAFLGQWLHLPASAAGLYVEFMAITRYAQVLVSVMGMAFLSLFVVLTYYYRTKINWRLLVANLCVMLLFLLGCAFFAGKFQNTIFKRPPTIATFSLPNDLTQGVSTKVYHFGDKIPPPTLLSHNILINIEKTHTLRVGYNPMMLPFCFYNKAGQLVGHDVAYMYALAKALHVKLVFIPFHWYGLVNAIQQRRFDIAIGSVYVTPERLTTVAYSAPYFKANLAFLVKRDMQAKFTDYASLREDKSLTLGVLNDPILKPIVEADFPHAKVVLLKQYNNFTHYPKVDGFLWTQEHTQAFATIYNKRYASVIPNQMPHASPLLMAFMLNKKSGYFLQFVNYWLKLERNNGFAQKQAHYWLLGIKSDNKSHRKGFLS